MHYNDVILGMMASHQPHDCLLNCLFRRRSKKTSKLRFTSLCAGNSPVTGEFPAQKASNADDVSIWWRHHAPEMLHWHWRNGPKGNVQNPKNITKQTTENCESRDHICVRLANERRRYIVTSSLIGWPHTQNDPCKSCDPQFLSYRNDCST